MGDHRGHHGLRLRLALRLGGDLQQAVALLGVGRHAGIRHGVHLLPEHLIHAALPDAEDAHRMGDDLLLREAAQIGKAVGTEHGHALVGRPRQHQDDLALPLKGAAGGRAPEVVEDRRPLGDQRLLEIVWGKGPVGMDVVVEALPLAPALHQGQAEGLGQDLLGQVVAGRPQTAGGDQDIRPALGDLHAVPQAAGVVPHHGLVADVDADAGEQLGHVPGVGVGDMAQQQLRTDGEDLGVILFHRFSARSFRCPAGPPPPAPPRPARSPPPRPPGASGGCGDGAA